MTPLEELQAAHKRLSELRSGAAGTHWTLLDDPMSHLTVTLHRTIDAQLAILDYATVHEEARPALRHEGSIHAGLILARAINGGNDD